MSIERQCSGTEEDGAKIHLGLRTNAHFERLQRLCESQFVIQIPPQFIVEGYDWRLKVSSILYPYCRVNLLFCKLFKLSSFAMMISIYLCGFVVIGL